MILVIAAFSLTVFLLVLAIGWQSGKKADLKASRLDAVKNASSEEGEGRKHTLSLQELRDRMRKKREAKKLSRTISAGRKIGRETPTDRMLQMADVSMSAFQFMLLRLGAGALLGLGMMALLPMLGLDGSLSALLACAGLLVGMLMPRKIVESRVKKKQDVYRLALPDVMDLLVVSVEAGLGFDSAILRLYEKDKSPLMQELMRAIQDVQRGMTRRQAYHDMAARCDVKELTSFLNALVQAEQLGISVRSVLTSQAEALREARRQAAEEKALKAPVKMLIPMVVFIFPVIFVVLLGPAVVNLAEFMG